MSAMGAAFVAFVRMRDQRRRRHELCRGCLRPETGAVSSCMSRGLDCAARSRQVERRSDCRESSFKAR
jgi:hypothetical protein